MSRKIRIILALVLLAAYVGYLQFKPKSTTDGDAAKVVDAPVKAKPVKPRMLGKIAFKACSLSSPMSRDSIEAQCAQFAVPEDRSQPNGRKIQLNLAWLPASSDADQASDPVFFLAGGPGQAAVESYPMLDPVFKEVRKHRDVILVDQRGTGKSNLLACKMDDAGESSTIDLTAAQAAATKCVTELSAKADLRHYTTTDAIADLDAVRQAIGAAQINLVGVSYGTRVAQQYAMHHPKTTRSIVLDSVVPNTLQLGNIFARNLDDALALQFALCSKAPACKGKLGDPRVELDQLLTKLRAAPVEVTYRDATTGEQAQATLNADTVAGLVRMYAYMPAAGALLPKLIHEANNGRYAGLVALAKMMSGDLKDAMAMGMQFSVICSEDDTGMVARSEDANTVLGNAMTESMAAMCKVWPKGEVPADFHQALATKVPALVLEGEFDPVTPPRYGEEVVKSLPNGRLFTLRGQGHNVIGAGCMPKLFTQFIEKADAKVLDGACLDKLNYVPPFTSFNGWEP
ncbi:alpha/beta hydrolase [Thermomonas sp.]|uniref:alpha/beta hydrolase n=1 Tax=Thermomonas sp. TaxID=1971895 RepID=UPI00248927EC|nr:alpha/beta hydrolase [Thermomonas sp.]MDI1252275.1 alpha/beta hydrolase [Thermomonas sp.]